MEQIWLGQKAYSEGLKLQAYHHELVRSSGSDGFLLGLEHPAVVTCGPRTDSKIDLKFQLEEYEKLGIEIFPVDRGGETTLHALGQMVIYPIISLRKLKLGVRDFVFALEEATLQFFKNFQIDGHRGEQEPGIYTKNGKIAFIGIRVDRGITRHGIAINICNDLSLFRCIRSCGKEGELFDKLENYGSLDADAMQAKLFPLWVQCFQKSLRSP